MSKLVRFINQGLKYFFIINGENLCDVLNEIKNCLSYSFTDSQYVAVLCGLSEDFSDSLATHETFHGREYVVLESYELSAGFLYRDVDRLAFSKPHLSITLLGYYLSETSVYTFMPASELASVFLLTSLIKFFDDGRSCEDFTLKEVFCLSFLSYLYHSYYSRI